MLEFGQTIVLLSLQVLASQLTFVKNQMVTVVLSLSAFKVPGLVLIGQNKMPGMQDSIRAQRGQARSALF